MVTKAELYINVLQELEKSTTDILSTAIVTRDGLIMSCTPSNCVDRETFAAYSAATFKHAGSAMDEISKENIDMLLAEPKDRRLIIMRATDYALLIALTSRSAQIGIVLLEMQNTIQKIKGL